MGAFFKFFRIQQKLPLILKEGEAELAVGIGINSGEAVIGAMGSKDRMDYTVLGATVNLGARLCSSAAKNQILISNSVFLNLERKIQVTELEKIKVKGITDAVQIYGIDWESRVEETAQRDV
jgi:adenylate cyclase